MSMLDGLVAAMAGGGGIADQSAMGPTATGRSAEATVVRRMQPSDRDAVLAIGAETGFFGDPIDAVVDDAALFSDLLYRYYVDLEPEHAWVAEAGGSVVGFVLGTASSHRMRRRWLACILPGVISRTLAGRYRIGTRTLRWLLAESLAALRGQVPRVAVARFPAHLHINVRAGWRGCGLGRRLLSTFLDQLSAEGVHGVHLRTTSRNAAACHLYESLGFRRLDERPTRQWQYLMEEPVSNLVYGLEM